ncbi:hypothetical protein DID76_02070 [Candidatus Marinamargulisbacteria bacterium SCGC AG-414-C22]|nr:hypothetical protein DID76_02070 [Candidatus Marinamargulisbacteria bacterium SCGC AG-414-C22]
MNTKNKQHLNVTIFFKFLIFIVILNVYFISNTYASNARESYLKPENSDLITAPNDSLIVSNTIESSNDNLNYDNKDGFDLDDIKKYLISDDFFSTTLPEMYQGYIQVDSHVKDLITVKDHLEFTGKNTSDSKCYLNGDELLHTSNGDFYKKYNLTTIGKHDLFFVCLTPALELFGIHYKIIKIMSPKDIKKYKKNLKYYNYFYNSQFLFNAPSKQLSDYLTRSDLAYFSYQLYNPFIETYFESYFEDLPKEHWAYPYISFSTSKKFMSEFADGLFYPQKTVSKIEALLTIIRVLNLDLLDNYSDLPFSDISKYHWSNKFLEAAIRYKLIPESSTFNPDSFLTIKDFMDLVQLVPEVQDQLASLGDFSYGFEIENKDIHVAYDVPYRSLTNELNTRESLQHINFDTPKERDIVYEDSIYFKGEITPATIFKFNESTITPNLAGKFSFDQALEVGINNFFIETKFVTQNFSVFYLPSYNDLNQHWVKETASQLRYLNIIPSSNKFFPNELVSNDEYLTYIDLVFTDNLYTISSKNILDNNVSTITTVNTKIQFLMQHNIIQSDSNNHWNPDKNITRAVALNGISNLLALKRNESIPISSIDEIPYWDILENNPYLDQINYALKNDLIAKGHNFRPNKSITKAELVSIIAKMPTIATQIRNVFHEKN